MLGVGAFLWLPTFGMEAAEAKARFPDLYPFTETLGVVLFWVAVVGLVVSKRRK